MCRDTTSVVAGVILCIYTRLHQECMMTSSFVMAALTATATAADSSCTDCQSDSGRTDCLSYGSFGGGDLVTHGDVRLRDGRHRERDA